MAPRQLLACVACLCAVSLAVAGLFWWHGATLVMPFAGIEVLALGLALLAHARHAADRETIRLASGALTVRCDCGRHSDCTEFRCDRVRVGPEAGGGSLIELSGQGRRMLVGRFVRPELREQLAEELRWALRHGPEAVAAGAA